MAALAGLALAVDLWRIQSDLDAGKTAIDDLDLDTVRRQGIEAVLVGAADHLAAAHDRARSSPLLDVAGAIPVIGTQVDAVRDLTRAADELGELARNAGTTISQALDQASGEPAARVTLLDTVVAQLDTIERAVDDLDIGAGGFLLPPLRGQRASVQAALDSVGPRFADLRTQVTALRSVLAGPTQYLINVGNNAEMRAGAGMPLSAGLATIENGDISLGEFKSTVSEMIATDPTGEYNANVNPALQSTYPTFSFCCSFPEIAASPNFPLVAPYYADVAFDTQGWQVEGIIHVDAIALAQLLEVVGPVQVGATEYTAETAPELVLNDPYLQYDSIEDRDTRIAAQSDLALALFDAIKTREIDLLDLVASLQHSAAGRHFMVWSRAEVVEDLLHDLGLSGWVGPGRTMVSMLNTSANKLDWYITPQIEVTSEQLDSGEWLVTMDVLITNPDGIVTSAYVDGFYPELEGGKHRTLLMFMVPSFASDLGISDPSPNAHVRMTEVGRDGFSLVFGSRFVVERGETRLIQATWRQPAEASLIAVAPSARANPVPWVVDGAVHDDDLEFVAPFRQGGGPGILERVLVALAMLALLSVWIVLFATELERRGLLRLPRRPAAR